MPFVIQQEDMHAFMRRSPAPAATRKVQAHQVQEAARQVLSLELEQKPFTRGNLYRFSASFDRDVKVQRLQDETMISLHFQLQGYSDATINHFGAWPFTTNSHNLMYLEAPELDLIFPTQEKYRYISFSFTPQMLMEKFGHIPAAIEPLFEAVRTQRPICLFDRNLPILPAMHQGLQDMFNNPFTDEWQSFYLEAKSMEMLALQISQYQALNGEKKPAQVLSARDTTIMQAIKEYAAANCLEPLSLQGIARSFTINEYQLKKQFRQLFGQTLFQHIHQCKMAYAKQQLLDTDKQVSEIAYELGYTHASHFIASFSKYFGVQPGKVKNSF